VARQVAAAHVARVHAASRRRYGSPRVTAQLAREGITVNHKAEEREMARQGLAGRRSRRKIRTTRRDLSQVPAADLVRCNFARPGTDELWIGDATYIWTDEGWCYLATVVDACSRWASPSPWAPWVTATTASIVVSLPWRSDPCLRPAPRMPWR